MNNDYLVVLFKNKERYKIIKEYRSYKNAFNCFNTKIKESNSVIFEIKTENGREVDYEISLIQKSNKNIIPIFKTDELGRNINIELNDSNYSILKLEKYKIPEKLYSINDGTKITTEKLIHDKLRGDSLKLVSKLNNKIIVQNDDIFNLYSLKSTYDAGRFLSSLESYMINNDKKNCLIVNDSSMSQKKYLYKVLTDLGYNKDMLYRTSTTHLKDK